MKIKYSVYLVFISFVLSPVLFAQEQLNEDFLKIYRGRYKGQPFRTYAGRKYTGGYSDHFPVYMILKLNR